MDALGIVTIVFGLFMSIAYLPQAVRIFMRRKAKDISVWTYLILFFGSLMWIIYGLSIKNAEIILMNALGAASVLFVLIGWYMYGRPWIIDYYDQKFD